MQEETAKLLKGFFFLQSFNQSRFGSQRHFHYAIAIFKLLPRASEDHSHSIKKCRPLVKCCTHRNELYRKLEIENKILIFFATAPEG